MHSAYPVSIQRWPSIISIPKMHDARARRALAHKRLLQAAVSAIFEADRQTLKPLTISLWVWGPVVRAPSPPNQQIVQISPQHMAATDSRVSELAATFASSQHQPA